MSSSETLVKIHFIEHIPIGAKMFGRHAVTLAMPRGELKALSEALQVAQVQLGPIDPGN